MSKTLCVIAMSRDKALNTRVTSSIQKKVSISMATRRGGAELSTFVLASEARDDACNLPEQSCAALRENCHYVQIVSATRPTQPSLS